MNIALRNTILMDTCGYIFENRHMNNTSALLIYNSADAQKNNKA